MPQGTRQSVKTLVYLNFHMTQPDLFGPETFLPPSPEIVELAHAVPPSIRFGTSTWTYDGWFGDVYHRRYRGPQPAQRLEEYARYPLFRTVQPGLAGMRNPDFLNAALFKDNVLGPYRRVFRDHAGCFVFEFQAMRGKDLPDPIKWADQLDDFFKQLPRDFRYAVELRNPELLTGVHGEALKRHAVAHVFNSWTEMPPIGEQIDMGWTFPADFTVARALLKPGRRYSDAVKQFQPYDRVQEPQPALRRDLLRLVSEAHRRRVEAFILANNRAEGNAPGTIRAVAGMWLRGDAEQS